MQMFSFGFARTSPVLLATSSGLMLLVPIGAGATDFEVEEWSVTWQDPDLNGIPNPFVRFDDFEDGIFDGAPEPDCFTLGTDYCEITGEVRVGDESDGLLKLRNPSFNTVSNAIDQFLFPAVFLPGPMTTSATYIFDVPEPGQSYGLQVFAVLPAEDFEQLAFVLSRGELGTPAVTNLFVAIFDVKRDVVLSAIDLGAAGSIGASTFDLVLSLVPAGPVLRLEACVRLDAGSCATLDTSGAPDIPRSAPTTAILGVVPGQIVEIDVIPGNDVNPVNVTRRGVIPVAILGSESFDVADVDASTLAFGPNGAALAHRNGPHVRDANHDGLDDLLAHFPTEESGIAVGDTEACLTGELLDGTPFEGCDAIATQPPYGRGFKAGLLLPPML